MNGFDRQQWFAVLMLLVIALFVSTGLPIAPRWRRYFRVAAIALFAVAVAVVLGRIGLWLMAGGR
jgi:hypothetical protein